MSELEDQNLKPSDFEVLASEVSEYEDKSEWHVTHQHQNPPNCHYQRQSQLYLLRFCAERPKTSLDKGNERVLLYSAMDFKCLSSDIIHLRQTFQRPYWSFSMTRVLCNVFSNVSLVYAYLRSWRLDERLRLWAQFELSIS
jgi:hypothetical protein